MNPRHRRLLIPGLLIALLVVVLVSSLVREAEGAEARPEVVSRIDDPRITESSGLAVSVRHDDLAYTVNDSGHAPVVYAVQISTGEVVGATTITGGPLLDTEALAIDARGTLWVADTGDNRGTRDDVALYTLPEPGPGDRTVAATRYPVTYDDGPQDVEALLVDPTSGVVSLVGKALLTGRVYALPNRLSTSGSNRAARTDREVPMLVTDGAVTADGRHAVLRTYTEVDVYDARTWELVSSAAAPSQKQGETLAIERSGRSMLLGSEGAGSELLRLPLVLSPEPTSAPDEPSATPTSGARATPTDTEGDGFAGSTWFWAAGVLGLLVVVAVATTRRT